MLLAAGLCAALVWPSGGRAHTPVTTRMLFNREIVRILKDNCLGCHRPGGIAPMSLATYEEARPWAKAIKEELLERRMPPWHAVKGYGEFRNAPRLSQRDVDAIVNWVEGGAPRGDASLLPPGPLYASDWLLGAPDAVLRPQAPRTVGAESDEHVDVPLSLDAPQRWLRAFDVRPGDASVAHCASLFLDGAKPSLLGTWVPGATPFALPEGVAWRLPARASLRLRIHYRGTAEPKSERSELGLYFAHTPPRQQLRALSLGRSGESARLAHSAEAIAIVPLADPRVASVQATAHRPDRTSEVLVWTRDSKADWRQAYVFKTPVTLPRGSRLAVLAHPAAAAGAPLATLFYTMKVSER